MRHLLAFGASPRDDCAMWRSLQKSAAIGLLLLAVALVALWARSYWHSDSAFARVSTKTLRLNSSEGSVHGAVAVWGTRSLLDGEPWLYGHWRTRELKPASGPPAANKRNPLWLLNLQHARGSCYANIPHWLLALLAGSAGIAMWRGTQQFTLRAMLALTALIAVAAAIVGHS